jgi:hypothetical protein
VEPVRYDPEPEQLAEERARVGLAPGWSGELHVVDADEGCGGRGGVTVLGAYRLSALARRPMRATNPLASLSAAPGLRATR